MTLKKQSGLDVPVAARDHFKNLLTSVGGSQSEDWNSVIANQTLSALWLKNSTQDERDRQTCAALVALGSIRPNDVLEAMMASQLISAHNAALECYRRAMLGEQTPEGRRENLNHANKLSRTYVTLLEALNRHRGKGQQKVTVEHVHVHAGGQALVGMVTTPAGQPGGGDASKFEEQPHAKQISHSLEPTLQRTDAERGPVPIPCDAERSLPTARRAVARRAEG